jgi:hypothetical protein
LGLKQEFHEPAGLLEWRLKSYPIENANIEDIPNIIPFNNIWHSK